MSELRNLGWWHVEKVAGQVLRNWVRDGRGSCGRKEESIVLE